MAYEFKKLGDVEVVETPMDTANVLIEEDGVIKKVAKDEVGGVKVASAAKVGQTIVVKAVDEDDKPTEWECADFPEGVKSWNELEDKPFYMISEGNTVVDGIYHFANRYSGSCPSFVIDYERVYKVIINGIEYQGEGYYDDLDWYVYIENSDQSLSVYFYNYGGYWVNSVPTEGDYTVQIIDTSQKEVARIDGIYLPEDVARYDNVLYDTISNYVSVKKVNNKTGNVTLTADDVLAVPSTRKINNKQLNADVTLNADDIGALPVNNSIGTGYILMNESAQKMSENVRGQNAFIVGTGNVASHRSMSVIGEYNSNGRVCREVIREPVANKIAKTNYLHEITSVEFLEDPQLNRPTGRPWNFFKVDILREEGIVPQAGMAFTYTSVGATLDSYAEIVSVDSEDDTYWYVTQRTHTGELVIDERQKYVFIVGNGTSETERSNAHTLDWNGNAWYAGTVEGTAMIVKSSTEGSTKRFKITVDDSGTLTAIEITE